MTPRERQIIGLIRNDPFVSQQDIARRLGISRSAVAGHIMRLTARGLIRGRGYVLADQEFVVCIGAANVDLHGKCDGALRTTQSNPGVIRQAAGGAARNVAENLARLGLDCRLVSIVGSDTRGEYLVEQTRAAGVDVSAVAVSRTAATSSYLAILDRNGGMRLAVNDMSILEELRPGLLAQHGSMIGRASALIIDTNIPEPTLRSLVTEFRDRSVFVDAVSPAKAPRIRRHLDGVHTLKITLDEARAIIGRKLRRPEAAADWLVEHGVDRVFVTLGDRGVCYATADGDRGNRTARTGRAVSSTIGAGDAFLAGLVYSHLRNLAVDQALDVALEASKLTIAEDGNVSPSLTAETLGALS